MRRETDLQLRIAHFVLGRCNPDSANGVDKTVYHLARAAASLGHDVTVYSLTNKQAIPIPGARSIAFAPNSNVPISGEGRIRDLIVDRSPFTLPAEMIADFLSRKPDFLHLHFVHVPQNVRLAAIARRNGIPYCVTINGGLAAAARRRNRHLKNIYRVLFERRYLDRAAFVHAVSEIDVSGLEEYGVRNELMLAPNGIDLDSVHAQSSQKPLSDRYPNMSGRTSLLFLGRLDIQQKGLDLLLEGMALAKNREVGLILVGPDWRGNQARLETLVTRLGLADRVVFVGPVFGPEKYELLAGADIFVQPSRWEGSSFSVLEAAAVGRPCILTERADPTRFVERHYCGALVETNAASVADGIDLLSSLTPEDRKRMGGRAREAVQTEFSWIATAKRLVAAYADNLQARS